MVNIREPRPNIRPHLPTGVARVVDAPSESPPSAGVAHVVDEPPGVARVADISPGVARVVDAPLEITRVIEVPPGVARADAPNEPSTNALDQTEEFLIELRAIVERQLRGIDETIALLRASRTEK